MSKWKKVSSRDVLIHPRIHLVEDDVVLPDGSKTDYLRQVNLKDYVTVIARHQNRIVMIYDYSYPNDQMLLQLPEGEIEEGETPEEAAKRELLEETGFRASEVKLVGTNLHHHRRSTAKNFIFYAEDTEEDERKLELEEADTELILLPEEDVLRKIAAGDVIQKNTLAAWAMYIADRLHKKA